MNGRMNANSIRNFQVKDNATLLSITSLLSILFFASHWADDIVRGFAPGGVSGLGGLLILVVWLYGMLVLGERRSGHVIMLLASILGLGVLALHMTGPGLVGGRIAMSSGTFFWVWTLIALGVTSAFSIVLSLRGLSGLRRGPVPIVQHLDAHRNCRNISFDLAMISFWNSVRNCRY